MDTSKNIAVIGAGIAGLAIAFRLANRGHKVTVFEANDYFGGKITVVEQDGFRFDAGPSLFTLPRMVDELLNLADKNTLDYFSYTRLPIVCKYFYEDGTVINGYAKAKKFAVEVSRKTGVSPQKVYKRLQNSAVLYQLTAKIFLESSLHRLKTYLNYNALNAVSNAHYIEFWRSMHQSNAAQFTDSRVIQLFDRFATYNGSNPYKAPATLNVIAHLEHNIGAYFPKGGMHSIAKTVYRLACEAGVTFKFQQPVSRIVLENGKAVGVIAQEKPHYFDTIVSNMDVYYTYTKLMPEQAVPKRVLSQEKSSSALIFYWGIKGVFPQLDLHNIFFSANYKEEFDCIFDKGTVYHDPTIYVNISAKYDSSDAPEGCENWFVMLNVPANTGQDWEKMIAEARKNTLEKLGRILQTDISKLILTESTLDPRSIESRTFSHQGSLYGSSSNSRLSAFLRHANFSSTIKELYFCGGSVHPGGGIPLCLLSAKIVDALID